MAEFWCTFVSFKLYNIYVKLLFYINIYHLHLPLSVRLCCMNGKYVFLHIVHIK